MIDSKNIHTFPSSCYFVYQVAITAGLSPGESRPRSGGLCIAEESRKCCSAKVSNGFDLERKTVKMGFADA